MSPRHPALKGPKEDANDSVMSSINGMERDRSFRSYGTWERGSWSRIAAAPSLSALFASSAEMHPVSGETSSSIIFRPFSVITVL